MNQPVIYVFDFDGVLCESVIETAITGWHAAASIWCDMPGAVPQEKIDQFRLARPIIETGYEAILTMRLLFQDVSVATIHASYREKFDDLIAESNLTIEGLKKLFGDTRDHWIAKNSEEWVNKNPLYDGVYDKLNGLNKATSWYIITTKHERFVKLILQTNKIEFKDEQIYGLDRNMSKAEVLKVLLQIHPEKLIYFIEDRLPTLLNVQKQDGLANVTLFFAFWGYNTAEDKVSAANNTAIKILKSEDFLRF